jgi:hypothetical protein
MQRAGYVEARREIHGLTAGLEKRVLVWLAERMPVRIQPDHLTALGLLSMLVGGTCYALTPRDLQWLHGVNLALLLNWFGDSLDGTLARVRQTPRPRYGFYVDHLVDAFGALFLFGGLAFSGLLHPAVAASVLVAYLLLTNEIALAAHVTGRFRISRGLVGGTELRILLAALNLSVLVWPSVEAFGREVRLLDALGIPAIALLLAIVVASGVRNAIALDRLDRGCS